MPMEPAKPESLKGATTGPRPSARLLGEDEIEPTDEAREAERAAEDEDQDDDAAEGEGDVE